MKHSPEELKRMAGVMLAAAEGKAIEGKSRDRTDCDWYRFPTPGFQWMDYDYRVKAEPMELELWVHPLRPEWGTGSLNFGCESEWIKNGWVKRKFREVVEEGT